jgi:hypothetical protein
LLAVAPSAREYDQLLCIGPVDTGFEIAWQSAHPAGCCETLACRPPPLHDVEAIGVEAPLASADT